MKAKKKGKPQIKVKPVTPEGILAVNFDQEMLYPEKIDQSVYNGVFQIAQYSSMTGFTTYGVFKSNKSLRRDLKGFNFKKIDRTNTQELNLKVMKHDATDIEI